MKMFLYDLYMYTWKYKDSVKCIDSKSDCSVCEIRVDTHGMTSGSTSDRMLIESVLVLEVGAAANRIFSRAIMYWGRFGRIA